MRKKLSLLVLFIYAFVAVLPFSVSAETGLEQVIDFYYESEFELYYLSNENCDTEWKDNALYMISTGEVIPDDIYNAGDPNVLVDLGYMFECDAYPWMKIKLKNLSDAPVFEMHFSTSTKTLTNASCTHVDISTKDTEFKEYVFNVPQKNIESMWVNNLSNTESEWQGEIMTVRLDGMWIGEPSGQVPYGSEMYIEYIAFFQTEAEANSFDIETIRADKTPEPSPTPKVTNSPARTQSAKATDVPKATDNADNDDSGEKSILPIILVIAGSVVALAVVSVIIIKKRKK